VLRLSSYDDVIKMEGHGLLADPSKATDDMPQIAALR
jgi:hypothetical protein